MLLWWCLAGSGKSVFVTQKILYKCLLEPRKVLVVRKTGNSLRESCWRLFLNTLSQWKILPMCKIRISEYSIELPNNSILLFRGLDDVEKIKSIVGIDTIFIEECTEITEEDYLQLSLRMRSQKKNMQIFLAHNPVSRANWVWRYFHCEEPKEKIWICHSTYKDNKFLTQQYIDTLEALKETNPYYYKVYALGEFASLDKLIFNNWEIQEFDYKDIEGELLCGLDFGFSADLLAFTASILNEEDKTIHVFKEWTTTGITNPQIAEGIKALGFGKSTIIADSAEPKSIQELKDCGLLRVKASKKGPDSVIHGIRKMMQYKIIVHPSCQTVITELENYSWKKDKSGEYLFDQPQDQFNHTIDSIRYSLQCVGKRLRTLDKRKLGV